MSNSRKVGVLRVRPQVQKGTPTGKWFVDIPSTLTGNGRRKRKLYGNRKMALEVARKLTRHLDPVNGSRAALSVRSGLLFREAVERWGQDETLRVATLKKRASTLTTDLYRLKALSSYFGDEDIAFITERHLTSYQQWRLEHGRKPRTINSELGTFALVMGWAAKHGYIAAVPKTEQIPVGRNLSVVPTPEEVVRIIEALPERLRPIVRFIAETGCRKGEALNLTWECVDEVNGYVEIRSREGWTPKTHQSARRIPLSASMLSVIKHLPKKGQYVFSGQGSDKPIGNFRKALRSAVIKADVRRRGVLVHLTPQALRKAHATWQAMRGVNESVLQDLLGHAAGSRVTKQYYVQATEDAKRAAVIELPLRN